MSVTNRFQKTNVTAIDINYSGHIAADRYIVHLGIHQAKEGMIFSLDGNEIHIGKTGTYDIGDCKLKRVTYEGSSKNVTTDDVKRIVIDYITIDLSE